MDLGKKFLSNAADSSALAQIDFHLFRLMLYSLSGPKSKYIFDIQNFIDNFNVSKPESFYQNCIGKFPKCCRKIIESQG